MVSSVLPGDKTQMSFSMRPTSARGGGRVLADSLGNVRLEGNDSNKSSLSARRPTSARSKGHSPSMFLDHWPTDNEFNNKTPASAASMSGGKLALELMMSMKRGTYTSSSPQPLQHATMMLPHAALSVPNISAPKSSAVRGDFTIAAANLPPKQPEDARSIKPTKPPSKQDASPRIAKMRPAQICLDQLH
jgi:hypothetical protein